MPLARIITTSAKYSDGLADDLRSRGFQVLTSAPGDKVSESADLEITLNECLADEARAASETTETKDMRVFLTPQAFAGKIRSIEMFVLTPKRNTVPSVEMEAPAPLPMILDFAAPPEVAADNCSPSGEVSEDVTAAPPQESLDSFDESDEPAFALVTENTPETETPESENGMGRVILASRQSAWPDMAEMKLVPAELAPASVRSVGPSLQAATPPVRIDGSLRTGTQPNRRFWKVPAVAGIAAVLALSAFWLANHFSASHAPAETLQQIAPAPVEAATPSATVPVSDQGLPATAPPSAATVPAKATRKFVRVSSAVTAHAQHSKPRRHSHSDADYVAKDTTVYFSRQPSGSAAGQKPQARP